MPVDKHKAALKTLLLAPVAPIQVYAVEQLLNGDPFAGSAGLAIGAGFAVAYVVIQEYDIPYEDAVLDIATVAAEGTDSDDVVDAATGAADTASDAADECSNTDD